ncbi:MAG TPA: chromate transporter, partial [Phnomibacter sp.]|nr:chromate transporter [Phnomibacter sp.]
TGVATRPWSPFRSAALLLLFGALWSIPFLLLSSGEDGRFWQVLILFFTKAALVTFGGAYAVLPYVAQVSVEKLHWLTATQMMDGLALGETTPGPLIMVLAFVGFMAAYNFFNASLIMAGVGLVITVHYTFLPCFLFIFAGAPIIERTRDNPAIKNVLTVITAAVVGVVLNLSIYLLIHVVYTGPVGEGRLHVPHLIWMIVSFIALFRFRQNMIFWLFISALYGLVGYLFSVWV